jgi:hypothetical protein
MATAQKGNNMKNVFIIILAALFLAGCTTRTEHGPCVGLGDEKDPKLVYKVDVWNAFLGIIFVETIIVPLIVIVDEVYCPVANKANKEPT